MHRGTITHSSPLIRLTSKHEEEEEEEEVRLPRFRF